MWFLLSVALAAPPAWLDDDCKLIPQGGENYQVMCRRANLTVQYQPGAVTPADALAANVAGAKSVGLPPGFERGAEGPVEWKGAAVGHVAELKPPAGPVIFSFTTAKAFEQGNQVVSCTAPGIDQASAKKTCQEGVDWMLANGAPTEFLKPTEGLGPDIRKELPDYAAPSGCSVQEARQSLTIECPDGMAMAMVAPPQLDIAATPRNMRDEMVANLPAELGSATKAEKPCTVLGEKTTCYIVEHSAGKMVFGSTKREKAGLMVQCAWAVAPAVCKGLIEGL